MLRNNLWQYGEECGRVPAHVHYGKEVFDNMVKNKELVALINADTDEKMTHGEFAQMTADIALSLTHVGVRKGDVVCICSEKRFEFLPTVLGVICAGATFSPMDLNYGNVPLLHRLKIVTPKVLFCSSSAYDTHRATFEEAGSINLYIIYGEERKPGTKTFKEFLTQTTELESFLPVPVDGWTDRVFVLYSSGTTGLPKGVPFTHLGCLLNAQSIAPEKFKEVCIFNTREWYHTYGLLCTLANLSVTATIVFNHGGQEKDMLAAVDKYRIKVLLLAPSLITGLIKSAILDQYDVTSVEYIVSSSTYIREEEVATIKRRLPNLVSVMQIYGLSEAGSACNELTSPKGSKPGSSGMPCLGFIMKVRRHHKYVHNTNPDVKDDEGFFKTGDVGYYDEDGYFFIVNRIKELIKYNDVSLAPAEFEARLLLHPAVREACVVGRPHPKHGEVPVAFVVLQPGCSATEEELVQHVDSKVSFKMCLAGGVRFIDNLPRGAGDKLDRSELKRRLQS